MGAVSTSNDVKVSTFEDQTGYRDFMGTKMEPGDKLYNRLGVCLGTIESIEDRVGAYTCINYRTADGRCKSKITTSYTFVDADGDNFDIVLNPGYYVNIKPKNLPSIWKCEFFESGTALAVAYVMAFIVTIALYLVFTRVLGIHALKI